MARILVTGAGGFIGRALCPALAERGHRVMAGLRAPNQAAPPIAGVEPRVLGDITPGKDWSGDLRDAEIVIHLAQRAHRRAVEPILAGEPDAAAALADAAARSGVRQFIYVSSIKAMGEKTEPGMPFGADDQPHPEDSYGRAKLATELALARIAAETGLGLVILRPPLVYGPGVGGNFRALLRLAGSGLPLPFAAIDNRRSLIFIDNLVDVMIAAAQHEAAAGRILLVSDGVDLSTPGLIRLLAAGQGRTARLFAVPEPRFAMFRGWPRIGPAFSRLTRSLQVDDRASCTSLGWTPPVAAETGLIATAREFAAR